MNRVTVFATNIPEENGNLTSQSDQSVKSTSSNSSSYVSATSTPQEQQSTTPTSDEQKDFDETNARCMTITSERNIDSGSSSPTMWKIADDLASPIARSKLSKKLSEAALTSNSKMETGSSKRVLSIVKSLSFLRLSFDAISDGSHLIGTSKSCSSVESSNEVSDELNGEEPIKIQADDKENHVVKFGKDNVLMHAFNFIDMVTKIVDEFKDRVTIKSVESKIYEQTKPIEKKRVYYANYPTDREDDHRGGIIYAEHPTQCRRPRN
ncbi:hypothetical protein M3Y96_00947400 [Aphelenchoides besseyi]|nr:hypothetical protein M3Y96_00947400 [Aphelenchoides besseyi]